MIRSFDAFVRFDTCVVAGFEARFSPRTRRWERRTTLEWRVPQLMFASVTSRFNLKQTSDLTCSGNPEEDLRAGQASNREVAEGKREPSRKWKGASRTGPRYAHEGNCGTPSLPPSCEACSNKQVPYYGKVNLASPRDPALTLAADIRPSPTSAPPWRRRKCAPLSSYRPFSLISREKFWL